MARSFTSLLQLPRRMASLCFHGAERLQEVAERARRLEKISTDTRKAATLSIDELASVSEEIRERLLQYNLQLRRLSYLQSTLMRMQIGQGLAPLFLERKRPYLDNPHVKALMDEGLLRRTVFLQKTPKLLRFYQRLLIGIEQEPRSILEIGVKGGGSTALWKALFPAATVVGLDNKLRLGLTSGLSEDGVVYVEGDQTDTKCLEDIASRYGPFNIVIDDGSHVADHQATTMQWLLPHMHPGGFYVVEDIHATGKKPTANRTIDRGTDIWADFTLTVLNLLRWGPPQPSGKTGAQLAVKLAPLIDDLTIGRKVLAIRVRGRAVSPDRIASRD